LEINRNGRIGRCEGEADRPIAITGSDFAQVFESTWDANLAKVPLKILGRHSVQIEAQAITGAEDK
jgi:hypothetical protein